MIQMLVMLVPIMCLEVATLFLLCRADMWLGGLGTDSAVGPQKVHVNSVSRVGGVAVFMGLCACVAVLYYHDPKLSLPIVYVMVAVLPAFVIGLYEDFTQSVGAAPRFLICAVSATMLVLFADVGITKVNLKIFDYILSFEAASVFLTLLAILTLQNGMNLIDGLNGLASGTAICIALGISCLTYSAQGSLPHWIAIILICCILPFLIFNFPFARVFLGDGGSYALGSSLAVAVIWLPIWHSNVSPIASLLLVIYPVYETIRTFLRRLFDRSSQISSPDFLHLHSLAFNFFRFRLEMSARAANPIASLMVLLLPMFSCAAAGLFHQQPKALLIVCVLWVAVFEVAYFLLRVLSHRRTS